MPANTNEAAQEATWSIEAAEDLIASLTGVLSARIVARPGGKVDEVHVLITEDVSPKQTVRNVESALMAHFQLAIDHRKISVAQTSRTIPLEPSDGSQVAMVVETPEPRKEGRVLFRGEKVETLDGHRIRMTVTLEWKDEIHQGEAEAADLPRNRLEAVAQATLRAMEAVAEAEDENDGNPYTRLTLSLEGVKLMDAFDSEFVLVAVNAMAGRDIIYLTGSALMGRKLERAVVLATLQATDRWVRGQIS